MDKKFINFCSSFFARKLSDLNLLFLSIKGFFLFSMVASAIYILNDYKDRDLDCKHPRKKMRPLASGKIGTKEAFLLFFAFLFIGLSFSWFISYNVFCTIVLYFLLNVVYCYLLKILRLLIS